MRKRATSVDVHVGKRMRELRSALGLTAAQLAGMVGLTQQQITKYEVGGNRAPATLLYQIAQALNTPISSFFDGLDGAPLNTNRHRFVIELIRNFSAIENEKHREAFSEVVRLLADR